VLADPHLTCKYITRAINLPRNGLLIQRYSRGACAPYDADHQAGAARHVGTRGKSRLLAGFVGAGEGIRTLDPDLGKVVLYP
jgi:hypothetical protein